MVVAIDMQMHRMFCCISVEGIESIAGINQQYSFRQKQASHKVYCCHPSFLFYIWVLQSAQASGCPRPAYEYMLGMSITRKEGDLTE